MENNKYSHPSPKCSGWQSVLYIMDIYWFTDREKRKSALLLFGEIWCVWTILLMWNNLKDVYYLAFGSIINVLSTLDKSRIGIGSDSVDKENSILRFTFALG